MGWRAMRCAACQTENPPRARFCLECGTALARRCAACGTELPDVARFCLECGQPVATGAATPTTRPAATSAALLATPPVVPQAYTPKHLAEKILAGREALQGERKQVTVLFADVVGSTALIRDRDPEESQRMLDGAIQAMMGAVHRYEGTVSRLMGDGLMAMFGAPIAHEDHAVRACYAALAMLDAIRGYAEEARRAYGETVQVRVGLNSGEVIVRLISDDLHMDYTAMGPTVHLASRMEGLAEAGTALLTASTLALVEGIFEARALGPLPVKGLDEPIPVYEVVGAGAARSRLHAAAARGLTRFVGRDDERAAVERTLTRARAGQGQVVALVGEPGVGKSRLVWEVTHAAEADGWTVLQAGAASYGTAVPYLPVVDLLRAYCRIEPSDRVEVILEKVWERLSRLDAALGPLEPPILALLDVPTEDASWQALDPTGRRRATLDAVTRLLLRESRERPVLLVVEDLHWLDSESQAVLDALVESVPGARIALLVNYRPEYGHAWGNRGHYSQVRIDALGRAGAEELLAALLGDDASIRPLTALLIERTEGNPFFLEESVRTLVETGTLVGERGAYRLARPIDAIRVPATVESVLAARIDRLPAEDKRLLQTAAVVGKDVPYALLQAIAETPEDGLRAGLARLQSGELMYPLSLFPELELTFTHALTHDVAYGSLLQERRKGLHVRIVAAIEGLYPDRLDEHVERLAHHASRAEVWTKAYAYCRQAGLDAVSHSANRAAVAWFEQALTALDHIPDTADARNDAVSIRLDLYAALLPLGEVERALNRLGEAVGLAEALNDQRRVGQVADLMSSCYWLLGDHDQAVAAGQNALAIAEAVNDLALGITANFHLGQICRERGEYRRSVESFRWNVDHIRDGLTRERFGLPAHPAVSSRSWLGWCLAEVGELAEATSVADDAVWLAQDLDHPYSLTVALYGAGGVDLTCGEFSRAIPPLERALELCETWSFPRLYPGVASRLGVAYSAAGRAPEGLYLLEQALERGTSWRILSEGSLRATWLGEAYLREGRLADAARLADYGRELASTHKERGNLAWAMRLRGEIGAKQELLDADNPETHYREALTLADELGMRPLQAHCHLGLGRLCRQAGRNDEARTELTTAVAMLRKMEMLFWLPEAEAELAQATAALTENASL